MKFSNSLALVRTFSFFGAILYFAGPLLSNANVCADRTYAPIGAARAAESKIIESVHQALLRSKAQVAELKKEVAAAYGAKGEALVAAVKREIHGRPVNRRALTDLNPMISSANLRC